MKSGLLKIICAFLMIFSFAVTANAQTSSDVSISMNPLNPGSNEDVSVSLVSYSSDLNKADITWILDGKRSLSGPGEKQFSFKTLSTGTLSKLTVIIKTSEGENITKSIEIRPSEIDLIWEATDSYVPHFYKGKALPGRESGVKIVAIPNGKIAGKNISASDLIYTWKRNFSIEGKMSGYGKKTFSFSNGILKKDEAIGIEARSKNGEFSAKKDISINFIIPNIVFYEKNPLSGIFYGRSIPGSISIPTLSEKTIVAEPYFFSVGSGGKNKLSYEWKLNNEKISSPRTPSEITLKSDAEPGVARASLRVENTKTMYQETNATLLINLE